MRAFAVAVVLALGCPDAVASQGLDECSNGAAACGGVEQTDDAAALLSLKSSRSQRGKECDKNEDCAAPPGLDHGVCFFHLCQAGQEGSLCREPADCASNFCVAQSCTSGLPGARCRKHTDCVVQPGQHHVRCYDVCQTGQPGDRCYDVSDCDPVQNESVVMTTCAASQCTLVFYRKPCNTTSDCDTPRGLKHPVCDTESSGLCQEGHEGDSCQADDDCLGNMVCFQGPVLKQCERGALP